MHRAPRGSAGRARAEAGERDRRALRCLAPSAVSQRSPAGARDACTRAAARRRRVAEARARAQVRTSNAFNLGMVAVLAACTVALGPLATFKLYFVPYWVNVVWLDLVTYLHHHGAQDEGEKIPWYRGSVRPPPGPAACLAPRGGARGAGRGWACAAGVGASCRAARAEVCHDWAEQ